MLVPDKKFIIGNWKGNPSHLSGALELARALGENSSKTTEVVICPPHVFLHPVQNAFAVSVSLGAQDIPTEKFSAEQLASLGVRYVILGHSSRRALGETDVQVNEKIRICLDNNLVPIICIGENTRDTEGNYLKELEAHIRASFAGYTKSDLEHMIIAYEPVWAIGEQATREASPEEFESSMIFIKKVLNDMTGNSPVGKLTIIYGGSVSTDEQLASYLTVGACGVLIGRASLDATVFNALCSRMKTL